MPKILLTLVVFVLAGVTTITFAKNEGHSGSSGQETVVENSHRGDGPSGNSGPSLNSGQFHIENESETKTGSHGASLKPGGLKIDDDTELEGSGSGHPSPTCAPENQWKNHGEYVSCIARLHQGGATTSAAARSDTGKKFGSPSASFNPSPSSSSSAEPSSSPESSTESASPSAAPESFIIAPIVQSFKSFGEVVNHFFDRFKHLFNF